MNKFIIVDHVHMQTKKKIDYLGATVVDGKY